MPKPFLYGLVASGVTLPRGVPTSRPADAPSATFAAGDANLGRYVGNGPTNATDQSGMSWLSRKLDEAKMVGGYIINNSVDAVGNYYGVLGTGTKALENAIVDTVRDEAQFGVLLPEGDLLAITEANRAAGYDNSR